MPRVPSRGWEWCCATLGVFEGVLCKGSVLPEELTPAGYSMAVRMYLGAQSTAAVIEAQIVPVLLSYLRALYIPYGIGKHNTRLWTRLWERHPTSVQECYRPVSTNVCLLPQFDKLCPGQDQIGPWGLTRIRATSHACSQTRLRRRRIRKLTSPTLTVAHRDIICCIKPRAALGAWPTKFLS